MDRGIVMDLGETFKKKYKIEDRHPWEVARGEVLIKIIEHIIPDIMERNITICDIGCGDAFIIDRISERIPNAEIIGIDTALTKKEIRYLNQKYENNIRFSLTIDDAFSGRSKSIDLILLLDLIEHIEGDVEFLKELKNKKFINDKTIFLITAPAVKSIYTAHDTFLKHFRRYNKKDIEDRLKNAGYTSMRTGYFFIILLIPRIIKKLKEKFVKPDIKKETGIGKWKAKKITNIMIKKILIFDFHLSWALNNFNISIPGLSLYTIFRKNNSSSYK